MKTAQKLNQQRKRRKRIRALEEQFGCNYRTLLDAFTHIDFMLGKEINQEELYTHFRSIGVNPKNRKEFYQFYDLLLDTFDERERIDYDYATNPKEIDLGFFKFVVYKGVRDYLRRLPPRFDYSSWHHTANYIPIRFLRDLDNTIQRRFLFPLVEEIEKRRKSKRGQADITKRIVQNIPYDYGACKSNKVRGKYPYEVLYDMKGVCGEKSGLLAFLLREMNFGVGVFNFEEERHRAVGIRSKNGSYGTDYAYIETTYDYHIGQIPRNFIGAKPELVVIEKGLSYD